MIIDIKTRKEIVDGFLHEQKITIKINSNKETNQKTILYGNSTKTNAITMSLGDWEIIKVIFKIGENNFE